MKEIIKILEDHKGQIDPNHEWELHRAIALLKNVDFLFDYKAEIDYQVDEYINYELDPEDDGYVVLSEEEREEAACIVMDSDWMNESICESAREAIYHMVNERQVKEREEQAKQKEDIFNEF